MQAQRHHKKPEWLQSFELDMNEDNFKYDRVMSGVSSLLV
jgi:hypothetical protein